MRKSKTTKVTLRFRMLNTGKETLYLDYYPGIPNPKTGETMRRDRTPRQAKRCAGNIWACTLFP